MCEANEGTPLYIHTLDTLCNELVSGRAVLVDDEGHTFRLETQEARSLFEWYRNNRAKWAQSNQKRDVEALVDQIDAEPPCCPAIQLGPDSAEEKRAVHLKSIKAHRFAGLHRYGDINAPPEDFHFEFEKPVTLVEGVNGSGKTSLLSAISWCLTGQVYRSQRPPEAVGDPVPVTAIEPVTACRGTGGGELADGGDDEGAEDPEASEHRGTDMTAITPLPSREVLAALGDQSLPLDTWVELSFVDNNGNDIGTIRRCIERSPRGRIKVSEPDLAGLDLDPISLEVGTKMLGLIPYIVIDEVSDLGQAVASLTGIKPLEDLVIHAEKSITKLKRDLVRDRQAKIDELDTVYSRARDELLAHLRQHPGIQPPTLPPLPGPQETIEATLHGCAEHFDKLQTEGLAESKSILGDAFDPDDPEARKDLMDNVGQALGCLAPAAIGRLDSAKRLRALAALSPGEMRDAERLLEKLVSEAVDLGKLSKEPDVADRLRLYARIAGWLKSLPEPPHVVDHCPVCQSALEGRVDPTTQKSVQDHILDTVPNVVESRR